MPTAIIVMGIAGSGKTTVGSALAEELGWPFYDADDFMPAANVLKMASGIALSDEDRRPWLDDLHSLIAESLAKGQSLVLACSALKKSYRERLGAQLQNVRFVYMKGDFAVNHSRLVARTGHFMKSNLLQSQFDILEEPENAIWVGVDRPVEILVKEILNELRDELTTS